MFMPDVIYAAADGLRVTLAVSTWQHIQQRHPEVMLADDEQDVLYASLGKPQPAITDEVEDDIGLRYCPPRPEIVGVTIANFRRHFPHEKPLDVVMSLLHRYPQVPWPADP